MEDYLCGFIEVNAAVNAVSLANLAKMYPRFIDNISKRGYVFIKKSTFSWDRPYFTIEVSKYMPRLKIDGTVARLLSKSYADVAKKSVTFSFEDIYIRKGIMYIRYRVS
jgi:DNA-binding XRE family transcriptional regulator